MPDLTDIPGNAVEIAKKAKSPAAALKGPGGVAAAGAALIALPYAAEGISKLAKGKAGEAKDKVSDKAKDVAGEVAKDKLRPSMPKGLGGLFDKDGGGLFGKGGDDDSASDDEEAGTAHGKGRRMPIQQSVDVAVPIKDAYDLWTQFEEWPDFMHRAESVNQVDDCTVAISTKVWGIKKEFEAKIVEQRPDERIEWEVEEGLSHSGVVTFHELAPRLTRIEVSLDVKPDSLLEKAGRGMRFAKRAVRGDLHRFKAYAEMEEKADNGWRGTIEDGDVKSRTERKASKPRRPKSRKSSSRRPSNGAHSKKRSSSSRSRS